MINVLVVDDDHLVRRGLISAMPWHLFEMKVVGEAGNGEKALEFLEKNQVDLLMTDLAMPVMSGIELIRAARKQYPNLSIAVLTMHQDFEFIQEALRLGAIDYIAKVQLEKEQFEEVLARIYARIIDMREKKSDNFEVSDKYQFDSVYALLSLKDKPIREHIESDSAISWSAIFNGEIMIWNSEMKERMGYKQDEELPQLPDGIMKTDWKLMKINKVKGVLRSDLHQLLGQYRRQELFYEYDGNQWGLIERSVSELQVEYVEPEEATLEGIRQLLHSFHWIYEDNSFQTLQSQLKMLRLAVPKLMQLLYGFTVDWNRLFRTVMHADISLPSTLICWRDVEGWMSSFRDQALHTLGSLHMNRDVSGSIMSAIKIIHDEYEMPLFAIDVARRVNLSRSYFNECFKKTTGHSFNEYLRKVRIDQARDYLTQTIKPIIWIAEHTGYTDEKYFSRVFRDQTGMLPSEYRQFYKQR